jgi:hypothetical protein
MKVLLNGAAAKKQAATMLNNVLEHPNQAKGSGSWGNEAES